MITNMISKKSDSAYKFHQHYAMLTVGNLLPKRQDRAYLLSNVLLI